LSKVLETTDKLNLFANAPVKTVVIKNVLPSIAAMIMVLIYNLADTFFIGQTGDALQVAAVSLATPVFLLFMAIGNIYGLGGTSVISRALGQGNKEYARKVCSFCFWSCVIIGVLLTIAFLVFMDPLLKLIGASPATWEFTKTYLTIVAFSGPCAMIATTYTNIIRTEGASLQAMTGQVVGNVLNIVLDPILILGFHWDIVGAAIATLLANIVSAAYYLLYFTKGKSILSISLKDFSLKSQFFKDIYAIGFPASLGFNLMSISQVIVNGLMAGYGDMALASIGVAMKVSMITTMVAMGIGQGVQPILGYCVGAKLWTRFKQILHFSLAFSFLLSLFITIFCYFFTINIVQAFLTNPTAIKYAVTFVHIFLTTSVLFGVYYVLNNTLQAMGDANGSFIINVSRQGIIYIPLLFILNKALGINGIAWSQPAADILSTLLVFLLYQRALKTHIE
jgi:putative MATE family efflux protein